VDLRLNDKVVLVTAASKGIGFAVAERFAREGARVIISSRGGALLDDAIERIGGNVTKQAADLTQDGSGTKLVERIIDQYGRLDILVSNTPGPRIVPALETTDEDWEAAYGALLRPAVQLSRRAAQQMCLQGSGSIVFLTSTWVKQPAVGDNALGRFGVGKAIGPRTGLVRGAGESGDARCDWNRPYARHHAGQVGAARYDGGRGTCGNGP
jgi:3-oxoacyl-[acyl-carrier protein] reductase